MIPDTRIDTYKTLKDMQKTLAELRLRVEHSQGEYCPYCTIGCIIEELDDLMENIC